MLKLVSSRSDVTRQDICAQSQFIFTDLRREGIHTDDHYLGILEEIATVDVSVINASRRRSSVFSLWSRRLATSLTRLWLMTHESTDDFCGRFGLTEGLELPLWATTALLLQEMTIGGRMSLGKDRPSIIPMFGGVVWVFAYEAEAYPGLYEPSHRIDLELYYEPRCKTPVKEGADVYVPITIHK